MRKDRHLRMATVRRFTVCMICLGAIAGAITYCFMSGAIAIMQPQMPHSYALALMSAIELVGGISVGWIMKTDSNCIHRNTNTTMKSTYWTGRNGSEGQVTFKGRDNA